jgi:hypothetical protein
MQHLFVPATKITFPEQINSRKLILLTNTGKLKHTGFDLSHLYYQLSQMSNGGE